MTSRCWRLDMPPLLDRSEGRVPYRKPKGGGRPVHATERRFAGLYLLTTQPPSPVFSESAELYDAIYFTFKDYAAESNRIAQQIRARVPGACSLLDVACGTGEHARLLSQDHGFEVDGIDLNPDFIRIAGEKNPRGRFAMADMVDFELGRRYDVVICMFSSIAYVRTLPRVVQTLRCFARHLAEEGIVMVEPWFPPGMLTDGHHSVREAEAGDLHIERIGSTEIVDRICRLRFDFTITSPNGTRHATELHELGLFTVEEMMEAFEAADLAVEFAPPVKPHRGLYIARHAEKSPENRTGTPGRPRDTSART